MVRALLEACGPVTSWKRMQDSDGRPKGFGFCEFKARAPCRTCKAPTHIPSISMLAVGCLVARCGSKEIAKRAANGALAHRCFGSPVQTREADTFCGGLALPSKSTTQMYKSPS